jgi:urease accessory protein
MAEFSGHLSLAAAVRPDGRTVLAAQSFRAPYHLSKPYWDADTGVLLVQVVNPTAGILSGDRLQSEVKAGPGAALLVTAPSASRVFRMKSGSAECRQSLAVAPGGWLELLPEPLVPHRGCTYRQTTRIEVAPGGAIFFADLLVSGRVAHGESWGWDRLVLETEIWSGGTLSLRERFDQSGPELQALAVLSGSGPAACFGNAVLIPSQEDDGAAWRSQLAALHGDGLWLGVSRLRTAGWSIKFVAPSTARLKQALNAIRRILAPSYPRLACDPRKL